MRGFRLLVAGLVATLAAVTLSVPAQAVPALPNGTLEAGAGNAFDCWRMAGWGTHDAALTAVVGRSGRAARITIGNYASGDRKFMPVESAQCAPDVTPGKQYTLGAWYTSTRQANLTVFRHSAAGWTYWTDLAPAPASAVWSQHTVQTPVVPEGTDLIAFGLGINGDGTLTVDDLTMQVVGDPPPPTADNLVSNGTLAAGGATPTCFQAAGWGTHNVQQGVSADVPAGATGRSWRIAMTNYASGDRKLIASEAAGCAPAVQPGQQYDLGLSYKSTSARNFITLFQHTAQGWSYWTDVEQLPAAAVWTPVSIQLPAIPAGVDRISFGVSLAANGTLLTTGYSLTSPEVTPPPPAGDLAQVGRWTVTTPPDGVRSVHATLLRDGRVMMLAGSGNEPGDFLAGTFETLIWNPATDTYKKVPTPADMFCAGHVSLADGRILIAGGTTAYPDTMGSTTWRGAKFSYVFDPAKDTYERLGDMPEGHWYPTLTKLENGDVWGAGGIGETGDGNVGVEMFDYSAMRWLNRNEVQQTYSYWGTYPHMYLLADGRMFYSGAHTFGDNLPGSGAKIHDWRTGASADLPGLRDKNLRDMAGSVLLPPAQNQTVMIAGGSHTELNAIGTDKVDIIDLNAANPSYVPAPSLPGGPRGYVNLANLPDRTVLATGGATGNRGPEVISSSVFLPATRKWVDVADDPVGRGYHSAVLVLPDGRAVTIGSNPADNSWEYRISVFEPPYLFKGTRPTVTAPAQATYGQQIALRTTGNPVSASLMSPMSATHQTDTNARLIDLPMTGAGQNRTATIPANRALVPPGDYMLTVLDANGVPSVAKWISVR